jgi:hypothetical protein
MMQACWKEGKEGREGRNEGIRILHVFDTNTTLAWV